MSRVPEAQKDKAAWEIDFSPDVIKANATVLVPITVLFSNNSTTNTERGWTNSLRNGYPLLSYPLTEWMLIYGSRDEPKARMFSEELVSVAGAMDFKVGRPNMIRLPEQRGPGGHAFAQAIKDQLRDRPPQMVVCIVPNTNKDIYDAIKRVCCVEYGIPSQVVTANILNTTNMNKTKSVITKLAVQMNCKLGGEPWGVTIPLKNMMVVGMDFYKDSSQRNTSVAAFVASINGTQDNKLNCTKYYSRCHLQPKGQEFLNGLEAFMIGNSVFFLFKLKIAVF
jgi:aubergine-like protein